MATKTPWPRAGAWGMLTGLVAASAGYALVGSRGAETDLGWTLFWVAALGALVAASALWGWRNGPAWRPAALVGTVAAVTAMLATSLATGALGWSHNPARLAGGALLVALQVVAYSLPWGLASAAVAWVAAMTRRGVQATAAGLGPAANG